MKGTLTDEAVPALRSKGGRYTPAEWAPHVFLCGREPVDEQVAPSRPAPLITAAALRAVSRLRAWEGLARGEQF